jgi:hypothetical protein
MQLSSNYYCSTLTKILVKVKANKIISLEKHMILNKSQFGSRNINPQNIATITESIIKNVGNKCQLCTIN